MSFEGPSQPQNHRNILWFYDIAALVLWLSSHMGSQTKKRNHTYPHQLFLRTVCPSTLPSPSPLAGAAAVRSDLYQSSFIHSFFQPPPGGPSTAQDLCSSWVCGSFQHPSLYSSGISESPTEHPTPWGGDLSCEVCPSLC